MISSTASRLRDAARRGLVPVCVVALTTTLTTRGPAQADTRDVPPPDAADPVAFERCTIGDGRARVIAECATLAVPVDHDAPSDARIDLAIARVPARRGPAGNTAFTLLAGGPGQSAIDSYAALAFAFRHINRDHDIVLIDQRGTGASGRLDCPDVDTAATDETLTDDAITRASTACRDSLDVDPRFFTTSVAVRDLERVRERLGIGAWHLYGVSYGTRVAQHYARRHTDRVISMILDAVVPPDRPLGPDIAPFADRALALVFGRCAADPDCGERFPDIGTRTRDWYGALESAPVDVEHEDPASGGTRRSRFGSRELATVLRLMSYNAQTAALLPSMLDAAMAHGHVAPLARQADLQVGALGETLASGMHLAIVCTEDAPRLSPEAARDSRATFLGTALVDALSASCRDWPPGVLDPDFHTPLSVDVPVLILSGEADPITPPAYGERVARTLPRARHVVMPAQGHMQAPLGCLPTIMAQFAKAAAAPIDDDADPGPVALDLDCLERIEPPPFFIDPNGPMP